MSIAADRLLVLLDHRRTGDPVNDAILEALCGALGDAMERLAVVGFGDPVTGAKGDSVLRDPSVAPLWALAHAALYTGASLPGKMADESDIDYLARARDAAVYPFGIRRGTHEAVRRAVTPFLTGAKDVFIADAYGGDQYMLMVRTRSGETPNPTVVRKALEGDYVSGGQPGAIRAELALTYVLSDDPSWLEATRTWTAMGAAVTWANVTLADIT